MRGVRVWVFVEDGDGDCFKVEGIVVTVFVPKNHCVDELYVLNCIWECGKKMDF